MSISELLSALRNAGREHLSASTVGTRQATGSHLLQIENYAQIKKTLSVGEYVKSSTFTVGGHDWRVELYPKGCVREAHGHVSLFLRRVRDAKTGRDDSATAKIEFSLLDGANGKPSLTKSSPARTFKPGDEDWGWREFVNKDDDLEDEKACLGQDGCLKVLCDVTVDLGIRADDACPDPEAPRTASASPPFELRGELARVIWKARRPDVRIEVAGEAMAAHRWMLAPRSRVFAAGLSRTSEKTAVVRVDDMDADVCGALLEFIYTGALHDMDRRLVSSEAMAERLLAAADRYGVEQLKEVCEKAVCRDIGTSSVAAKLALAKRHGCPVLRDACLEFLSCPGNLEAVVWMDGFEELMEAGCPSGLTKLIVKQVRRQEQWSPFSS